MTVKNVDDVLRAQKCPNNSQIFSNPNRTLTVVKNRKRITSESSELKEKANICEVATAAVRRLHCYGNGRMEIHLRRITSGISLTGNFSLCWNLFLIGSSFGFLYVIPRFLFLWLSVLRSSLRQNVRPLFIILCHIRNSLDWLEIYIRPREPWQYF